jgi:tetratricopeptide (TPR) repeat protein
MTPYLRGVAAFLLEVVFFCRPVLADEICATFVGRLVSVQGDVTVARGYDPDRDKPRWQAAQLDQPLCPTDTVRVGSFSRAEVLLFNQPTIRLDQHSTLRLKRVSRETDQPALLNLLEGAAYFFSRQPRRLDIDTPYLNSGVEGTEFLVRVTADESLVSVFEGRVVATNARGRIEVTSGNTAAAAADTAPVAKPEARSRDAVQWALHYPTVLVALSAPSAGGVDATSAAVQSATAEAARGDVAAAMAAFERVPAADRDASFFLHRAAALLSVGRVEAAQQDIASALALDPSSGLALAMRAVIAVARNETEQALADAEQAVALAPSQAAARIALSYAQQSAFDLDAAADTLERAVADTPGDALAWARLGELRLALGQRRQALAATATAERLAPDLERVQTVRGFAHLAAIETAAARVAFQRAIALDSASPLPRLGLGLAEIRDGNVRNGRREIETAVALDPGGALLRSYLGKAYFEERREDLAEPQYNIAKALDPTDPTPWFYSALLKQSANRPVEALQDLRQSIARNDNRAVYRSRQLLDSDRAGRSASLARIYNDLGFQQLGQTEAASSLAIDPANSSAHRFLADLYATQPRREIARVSELLQAQLLQDVNINPVQPSLSEINLGIASHGGPSIIGINEYTPLFERNQVQLNTTGVVGNHYTRAGEAIVSAVHGNSSVSAGYFHYTTDGYRRNLDLRHDIGDFFLQTALTPEFNVQTEVIERRSTYGDRTQNFAADDFAPNQRRDVDQGLARFGLRYSPEPGQDVIGSFVFGERQFKSGVNSLFDFRVKDYALQGELEYIWRAEPYNGVFGFGAYDLERRYVDKGVETTNADVQHNAGFAYLNVKPLDELTLTVGVSVDVYDEPTHWDSAVAPKLGLQWQASDAVRLRLAAFRTLKPPFAGDRTIQPTQVAGFNQFFDDANGTDAWRYAAGLDVALTDDFAIGFEASKRSVTEVVATDFDPTRDKRDEELYHAYLFWTPHPEFSLSAGFSYDRFRSDPRQDLAIPKNVSTISAPVSLSYFSPSGFMASLTGTFIHQDVKNPVDTVDLDQDGHSSYFVADAAIGYRLPHRRGFVGVELRNIFDERTKYQDDSFREFRDAFSDTTQVSAGRFIPERTILARVTLSF